MEKRRTSPLAPHACSRSTVIQTKNKRLLALMIRTPAEFESYWNEQCREHISCFPQGQRKLSVIACSRWSDSRARRSDGGERVIVREENEGRLGREQEKMKLGTKFNLNPSPIIHLIVNTFVFGHLSWRRNKKHFKSSHLRSLVFAIFLVHVRRLLVPRFLRNYTLYCDW